MEVVSFNLYQRKLIFHDLSAMFYNSRGRERVGLAGCVCVSGGGGGGGVAGGRGVGADRQTDRERKSCIQNLFVFQLFCRGGGGGGGGGQTDRQTEEELHSECICFSTVLQVTAVEVKPI